MNNYDWNKISLNEKKEINKEKPIFIMGSREMSERRVFQLAKQLSVKRKILWGILKDPYINGLEDSPQFKSLEFAILDNVLKDFKDKVSTIEYYQRDINYILKELDFSAVIFINGSWYKMLHLLPEFWTIINKKTPYKLVSSFLNETEAKEYLRNLEPELIKLAEFEPKKSYSDLELMELAAKTAKKSFDWVFQIGAVLADQNNKILIAAHNKIMPFETASAYYGSIREKNFSPAGDLNHYDTNHAEVELILESVKKGLDIYNSKLYINVLPCPSCARMIADSPISEIIYQLDHSDGYAVKLFEAAGKKVRRLVN